MLNGDRKTTALSYMDEPLNLWVVGTMQSLNIYIGAAAANPTVRLAVDYAHDVDRAAHADLLRLVHRNVVTTGSDPMRMWTAGGAKGGAVSACTVLSN